MERLVIILVAFVLCWMNRAEEEEIEVLLDRATKLNPDFYVDENAFMEVANALGFGNNSSVTANANVDLRNQSVHAVSSDSSYNVQSAANRNGNARNNNGGPRRGRYSGMANMASPPN